MSAEQCVNKYIKASGPDEAVDALISGIYSGAVQVRLVRCVGEPDKFLLWWTTSAVIAAQVHADELRSANTLLPVRFQNATMIYYPRKLCDNKSTDAHFKSRKELYFRTCGVNVRFGGAPLLDNDHSAYPHQVSEWDLKKLLSNGQVPDARTALFILAILDAELSLHATPMAAQQPSASLTLHPTHSSPLSSSSSLPLSGSSEPTSTPRPLLSTLVTSTSAAQQQSDWTSPSSLSSSSSSGEPRKSSLSATSLLSSSSSSSSRDPRTASMYSAAEPGDGVNEKTTPPLATSPTKIRSPHLQRSSSLDLIPSSCVSPFHRASSVDTASNEADPSTSGQRGRKRSGGSLELEPKRPAATSQPEPMGMLLGLTEEGTFLFLPDPCLEPDPVQQSETVEDWLSRLLD